MLGKIALMSMIDGLSLSCYKRSKKRLSTKILITMITMKVMKMVMVILILLKTCPPHRDKRFVFVYIFWF